MTHQAGIYAEEDGYDIHVGNGTTLEGAVIKSEALKAKNTLTTKSLDMKDIQNEAEYTYSNNGIGYKYYGSKKKIEERQELARLFSKNAFEQLHNWQPTTKDGKVAKSIAHGIIGEVAARMAGNTPGSGFKATMTNEMLIEKIKQIADNDPALAQWLSAAVGGVVNKVSGGSLNAGVTVSIYATKWNEFQNEPELFDQLNEIKKNNYIVSTDGESFDLRSMKNGAYYVISVKDKITNKYKSIAIDNKLQMFDIVYEDGGTS